MRRAIFLLLVGCNSVQVGGSANAGADDDPLNVSDNAAEGSLDYLHRTVVVKSCAGQPGLCHAGQFDPNLSTPALFYANLVNRPGVEHDQKLRVKMGDPDASFIIDKLRNRNVATQMPLGAKPLPEEQIALFERWIRDGALRRPGATPPEVLNNPPQPPTLAVWSAGGVRLDGVGPAAVSVGETITLRHTVKDFETTDADIAYAAFFLNTADGSSVLLDPEGGYPAGQSHYDPNGPTTAEEVFDYKLDWTIPPEITLQDPYGVTTTVPSVGQTFDVYVYYQDQTRNGASTLAYKTSFIQVK